MTQPAAGAGKRRLKFGIGYVHPANTRAARIMRGLIAAFVSFSVTWYTGCQALPSDAPLSDFEALLVAGTLAGFLVGMLIPWRAWRVVAGLLVYNKRP